MSSTAYARLRPLGLPTASLLLFLLLAGCASRSHFAVAARHDAGADASLERSYALGAGPALLGSGAAAGLAEPLLADVRTALSSRGYFEAPAGTRPALRIDVELVNVGPVQQVVTSAEPVYVLPPMSTPRLRGVGRVAPPPSAPRMLEREVNQVITVFPQVLTLAAHPADAGAGNETGPLWQVAVVHVGDERRANRRDARRMVAAAMDWIGRESTSWTNVALASNDRRILFLDRGLDRPVMAEAGDRRSPPAGTDARG